MSKGQDPRSFDWDNLEKLLGTSLPLIPKGIRERIENSGWVESYVQDMLTKMMPTSTISSTSPTETNTELQWEEFETHKNLILKMRIPETIHPRSVHVQVGRGHVKIYGLPKDGSQIIPLSQTVDHLHCRAFCKNRSLLIRMRKETETEAYREIRVRHEKS
ncbi:hypothetical protein [Marinicrinis sediminis]|uniref:Hsp20/alpha crystallin family protein n=1 Tax=Marinicrinis sediminis TaxID=1652465 RepID=A0ABW5R9M0_9BACL